MKSVLPAIAVAAMLIPTAGTAASYNFTVKNGYTDPVSGASVAGGKVEGFKPIPASGKRSFTVNLPDGTCVAELRLNFADGNSMESDVDFCESELFTVTYTYE